MTQRNDRRNHNDNRRGRIYEGEQTAITAGCERASAPAKETI